MNKDLNYKNKSVQIGESVRTEEAETKRKLEGRQWYGFGQLINRNRETLIHFWGSRIGPAMLSHSGNDNDGGKGVVDCTVKEDKEVK